MDSSAQAVMTVSNTSAMDFGLFFSLPGLGFRGTYTSMSGKNRYFPNQLVLRVNISDLHSPMNLAFPPKSQKMFF